MLSQCMANDPGIIKVKMDEFSTVVSGNGYEFPKYATQIINLANQNAQGTRPKIVGQMSDLIQECPSNDFVEWGNWYMDQQPDAINDATERIMSMVNNFKKVIVQIDEAMVRAWVKDLVITKTFVGLKVQQGILKTIANKKKTTYRLATPEEESKGIDGFIGVTPVSIKPLSYKTKNMLREVIDVKIIYYDKKKDGIDIYIHDLNQNNFF